MSRSVDLQLLGAGGRVASVAVGSDGWVGDLRVRAAHAYSLPLHRTRLIGIGGLELSNNAANLATVLSLCGDEPITVVDGFTGDVARLVGANERMILQLQLALRASKADAAKLRAVPATITAATPPTLPTAVAVAAATAASPAAAVPASSEPGELPLTAVGYPSSEMDAESSFSCMLAKDAAWITKLASHDTVEFACFAVPSTSVVRAIRLATYGDSRRYESRVEEWDPVSNRAGSVLLNWKKVSLLLFFSLYIV